MTATAHTYLIAIGSNMPHVRQGRPRAILAASLAAMERRGLTIERVSPFITSDPVGPSIRRYANGAVVVRSGAGPREMLAILQSLERSFDRKKQGRRWRARTLDCDIILWSGGAFHMPDLTIPHRLFRERDFVLGPAASIAPRWRDPITGLTLQQLHARLTGHRPIPRWAPRHKRAGPLAQ